MSEFLLLDEFKDTNFHFFTVASGLKILRDNNLIHRDLKPQVSLPSTVLL